VTDSILESVVFAVSDGDCLVALGGGADSAVLLWGAVEALGRDRVKAVFVYHGLEGSDALRTSAVAVSRHCGVQCDVIERLVDEGGNLEARARSARYDAIEAVIPHGTIALTGHTSDDQAETVLMRLVRGSGAGAISGIPYRRGIWRRPLLGFSRASLRRTAEDLGLPFADDPANADPRFMRARIRHDVMPVIEAKCGPDTKALINRSSQLLAADDEVLEAEADKVPILPTVGGVSIPTGPLVSSPVPVASRVVRRALRMLLGGRQGSASDVDAILSVARSGGAKTISDALQAAGEAPFVSIYRHDDGVIPDPMEVEIGESFTWSGQVYSTTMVSTPPPAIDGGRFTLLGARAVGGALSFRGFEPGDRIDIGTGSTPITEVLRATGVPARLRMHSLVVTVDAKIAALVGVRVSSWAKAERGVTAVIIEREVGTWT